MLIIEMKRKAEYFCLIGLVAILGASCTGVLQSFKSKPAEEECMRHLIQNELDLHGERNERDISLDSWSNGVLKLRITATNNRPFSNRTLFAVRNGESMQSILKNGDQTVSTLIDLERDLKKMSRIKTVSWTADEPCAPGFVCQTTGSSERSAEADDRDLLCSEYRK